MKNAPEKIVPIKGTKAIEEIAASWVARMDSRELSLTEQAALNEWLANNPKHKEAFKRISSIWSGLDTLDDLNYVDTDFKSNRAGMMQRNARRGMIFISGIAALLLFAFFIHFSGYLGQTETNHFVTAIGEQQTVHLVDGSTLILNTNSEVKVEITEGSRQVVLIRGEVHFEVASNPKKPFRVRAANGIVKAIGTAFTVYLRERAVEVTVTEGIVELLAQKDEPEKLEPSSITSDMEPLKFIPIAALTAGQNAVFTKKVDHFEQMDSEVLERRLLWREGYIAFAGEPLSKVVTDISRYTNIDIDIEDDSLSSIPIGGYFKVGDVESLFEALENIFNVKVDRISTTEVKLTHRS